MAASRKFRCTELLPAAVSRSLERHVKGEHTIALGLSGGVDSVVLLHVMHALQAPFSAVHIHHGLSPHADQWADFCLRLCGQMQVPLAVHHVQVERGSADGLEAAARRARHAVFDTLPADWLGLAHHRDDRAETLLFNLLRGAGVRGAGALPEQRQRLLRPLLTVGREDIVAYAQAHGLTWVDDESNRDTRYTRNFLRHDVMPNLRQRFPAVEERLASAATRFEEASRLLDELARIDLGGVPACFPLPVAILRALPEARARNLLRFLLGEHQVGIPSELRLTEFMRQCLVAGPDRHPAVNFGRHQLRRQRGLLVLESAEQAQ